MRSRSPEAEAQRQRGSAVVELALLLPILLLVLLAVVQVGVVARDQLVLVQSARAGARAASVDPDESEVHAAARDAAAGLDPAALDVQIERAGSQGDPVTVSVGYDVPISGLVAWLLPDQVHLTATATMRQEFA